MENRSEGRVERKKRTVVLNDLPEGTSLTQLIDLFSQFGKM
ncbi:hypothetical protein M153_1793000259 [Pseudoloma neurophilia]|uniref:Uncharacterized protein n=1 Tax=Pseudoloma neurophilia TaxID=146866 RepID=A0A0R0LUA1_9MICR|nr:hypothetical protein M153_1793000259 [Pseudoloma neurophilia]